MTSSGSAALCFGLQERVQLSLGQGAEFITKSIRVLKINKHHAEFLITSTLPPAAVKIFVFESLLTAREGLGLPVPGVTEGFFFPLNCALAKKKKWLASVFSTGINNLLML